MAFHEAGHFLIAYMTGLMPLAYTLSSLDAYLKYKTLNVQAGCRFADEEFNQEVQSGKVKSSSLERFSCVALAGVLCVWKCGYTYRVLHVRLFSYCSRLCVHDGSLLKRPLHMQECAVSTSSMAVLKAACQIFNNWM